MIADITEIKRALESRAHDVAEYLLPRGVLEGSEWCVGSTAGEPGKSLKVRVKGMKAGTWADFAALGESGDLIDLWCFVKRCTLTEALDGIRTWLGMELPEFEKKERSYRRPEQPKCTAPKSDVLEYLTLEQKLSANALRAYEVGEDARTIIFRSCLPGGELAFVKHLRIDRTAAGKKVAWVDNDCEPVLFGCKRSIPKPAR